jgi:hypothetical protein
MLLPVAKPLIKRWICLLLINVFFVIASTQKFVRYEVEVKPCNAIQKIELCYFAPNIGPGVLEKLAISNET